MEAEREEKHNQKQARVAQRKHEKEAAKRSATGEITEEILMGPSKMLEPFEQAFSNSTAFFSTYNPDMIEEALVKVLRKEKIEPKVSPKKYKLTFTRVCQDENTGEPQHVKMCVRILRVDEEKVCVEF